MWAAIRVHATLTALLVALGVALPACLADDKPSTAAPLATIPEFSLPDAHGNRHSRVEWRDAKAVVILFLGAECPVSNGYSPTFRQIAETYSQRGVTVVGVHCDASLSAEAAAAHAKEYGLPFAVLLDPQQVLARGCGVRVTPEAVVARADGEVLYRGRIDNKYSLDGKRRDEATVFDLAAALEATLAGALPKVRETRAFGCPLPSTAAK